MTSKKVKGPSGTTVAGTSVDVTTTAAAAAAADLPTGFPSWHSLAFVVGLGAICMAQFPSVESLDTYATLDRFTNRVFEDSMSLQTLGIIRAVIALSNWATTIYMMLLKEGWTQHTTYRKPASKLTNVAIQLTGFKTLCPFTSWCWIFLGISFTMNATLCLLLGYDLISSETISPWILRVGLVMWEVSAPLAILVSTVVRYAIWPAVLASGKPHSLAHPRNQLMHNMNSIFCLTEKALLGGLPLPMEHAVVAPMVGVLYVLFAWNTTHIYRPASDGPQFLYWFFDTTVEKTCTIALVVLLVVCFMSYGIFGGVCLLIDWSGGGVLAHTLVVGVLSSMICRVRD